MANFHVEIVTPSKKVFEGTAYMVVVPGVSGEVGFLPGHVSMVTELGTGYVKISDTCNSDDASAKKFKIEGGYAQVSNESVVVLAEHVELGSEQG